MNLRDLTIAALKQRGLDGLCSDWGCGCKLDDLMPCGEPSPECVAGMLAPCDPATCPNDGDCPWHIEPL